MPSPTAPNFATSNTRIAVPIALERGTAAPAAHIAASFTILRRVRLIGNCLESIIFTVLHETGLRSRDSSPAFRMKTHTPKLESGIAFRPELQVTGAGCFCRRFSIPLSRQQDSLIQPIQSGAVVDRIAAERQGPQDAIDRDPGITRHLLQ